MGDVAPGRRQDALRSKGIPAVDYMQVFRPSEKPDFDPESDLVALIRYPISFKLLSVLDICYAIQLDSDAKRYTLQCFNCYFFVWTIILILGRQTAEWDQAFSQNSWDRTRDAIFNTLALACQLPAAGLAFKLEKQLIETRSPHESPIIQAVDQHVRQLMIPLRQRAKSLLWTRDAPGIIKQRVEHLLRRSISQTTLCVIFPEFGKLPPKSPITPLEAKLWDRAQYVRSTDTVSNDVSKVDTKSDITVLEEGLDPPYWPVLSRFIQAPMFEASSYLLSAMYSGVASITQPQQIDDPDPDPPCIESDDWHSKLVAYLSKAVKKEHDSALEKEFTDIIDSHPEVDGLQWRQALIQICDAQVSFFRSSPLPQLWDQWLWDAVKEDLLREIGSVIPRAEPTNLNISCVSTVFSCRQSAL
jgi:hypothetical protein